MDLKRRTFTVGLLAALGATSGCLGFVRGEDALAFEAVGARPSEGALAETDYRHAHTGVEPLSETIEIGERTREVELTNVVAEYGRDVDLGALGTLPAATFAVLATPQFEVLGRTFHPGERVDPRRLVSELDSTYDAVSVGEELEEWSLTVFDERVDVSTFEGRITIERTEIDARVHVGTASNDDDLVIFAGAHPTAIGDERTAIARLAGSLVPMA
ncbi:DUF6517 family protein [Halalkalicoccus jeotgali]|uniref:Lipoprotein n=1 Tax=Halalkalicoccus jeotgali (strain DSM 18796 / CECT 7217 / JCM 14584 / KCTC 4019 / B3) TaxID=795797 RepID=D8J2X0_HALJB|nr:DUF6517 family protein [Halalkalicoccus jeotgali]ADJ15077.1 hypothetical protein HacjB3_08470 [Halalkalicoccus jeotgali B3]ELY34904.1 hypothetical protein C497_14232 [Halalkalicoccus jeotgali B3]